LKLQEEIFHFTSYQEIFFFPVEEVCLLQPLCRSQFFGINGGLPVTIYKAVDGILNPKFDHLFKNGILT
jgi:hypothetical protein